MKNALLSLAGAVAIGLIAGQASAQTLLLHYDFDEASSGSIPALDHGDGTPAPGSFEGGATRTGNTPGGHSLGAADLSTDNTYVTTPSPAGSKLDGLDQYTLTAWVNLQDAPVHGNRIMAKQSLATGFPGFSFAFNNSTSGTISADNFQLNLAQGGVDGFAFNTSGVDLDADNKWIFVAVTYDGTVTTENLQFWSGDELTGAAALGPALDVNVGAMVSHAEDFRVGAQSAGTVSAPVWIDDVRVYGSVLSGDQLNEVRLANVPEPASVGLLGLAGLGLMRRRRQA